ncbi:hypothetical protein [Streptomyces chartreusis]|uniref:Lipoprotein n=1 Tax=Streptomyces chartreusis TaxID=1969 RepID=A0A7H8TA05_STRCX|nr:hypothetical protein [Streptomyces chartreusis]QKZ20343.1 hypothetical protein HUT05_25125 [Streptomyces chartreusis]
MAATVSLTACENGADPALGGSTPSAAAKAKPAAEPNGVEKLSAKEIYDKGRAANAQAGSFREKSSREEGKGDLMLSATECVGSVEMTGRGSFEIVRKDNDVWAKLDTDLATWVANEVGLTISAGTWLHGTPTHPFLKGLLSWCHSEQIGKPDTASANLNASKGKVTTVDGQRVVPIYITGKGDKVTWYTATEGEPYYVKQDATREDMTDISFSDFGEPVGAQKPVGTIEEAPTG